MRLRPPSWPLRPAHHLGLALAILGVAACGPTAPNLRRPNAPASGAPKPTTLGLLQGQLSFAAKLPGGILSNESGRLVSDNGGGLVSDNGGGLVSDNGGGVISNHGGGLQGAPRFHLAQSARPETRLADAVVALLDLQGQPQRDAAGKALESKSDAQGRYAFPAQSPARFPALLRVAHRQGGALLRYVAEAPKGEATDLNTASSLGTAYVRERLVPTQPEALGRLPESEARVLYERLQSALAALPPADVDLQAPALATQTQSLREQNAPLAQQLEKVEAILLAGQSQLGDGLLATQVPLASPVALAEDGAGGYFVAEGASGRIRQVDAQGRARLVAGHGAGAVVAEGASPADANFGAIAGLARGSDGSLYVSANLANRVYRLPPQGAPVAVALGNGQPLSGPLNLPPTEVAFWQPGALAMGPDGRLWVGERPGSNDHPARIVAFTPGQSGPLEALPPHPWPKAEITGLAVQADGTAWALNGIPDARGGLAFLKPGATSWTSVPTTGLKLGLLSQLALGEGGAVLLSDSQGGQVHEIGPQGPIRALATPAAGGGGPLTQPSGMLWLGGRLLVAESGRGLVQALGSDGGLKAVAGSLAPIQIGQALSLGLNQPGGLALDAQGELLFSESGAHAIKRLVGQRIELIAGGRQGFAGDGGPALQASFTGPSGLAVGQGSTYLLDSGNQKLRAIGPDGLVRTLVGGGAGPKLPPPGAAEAVNIARGTGLCLDADGRPVWVDNTRHQLCRLTAQGQVEVVAGDPKGQPGDSGDGGLATQARLSLPSSVALAPNGDLYLTDTGNLRVRRIDRQGLIHPVVGQPITAWLAGQGQADPKAFIWGPVGLAFGPDGALYIGEAGTTNLSGLSPLLAQLAGGLPRSSAKVLRWREGEGLSLVAGEGSALLPKPGDDDGLRLPSALLVKPNGDLVIADLGLNQLKLIPRALLEPKP